MLIFLEMCAKIRTLILNDCRFLDDWSLARIAHNFSETLENLHIKNCEKVTDDGLMKLGYLKYDFEFELKKLAHY
jgi:hypothetical protein